jgi:hypothetical protein
VENASLEQSEAGQYSMGGAKRILADQPCPNASLCRRWSATDDGAYCRLCWREFTYPRLVYVAQRRA